MRFVLILWLVVLAVVPAAGQHVYSRNFTIHDGLPSNTVRCVLKDSHDRMWVGTAAGLCLYDGMEFEVVQNGSMPAALKVVQNGSMPAALKVVQGGSRVVQKSSGVGGSGSVAGGDSFEGLGDGVWLHGLPGVAGENVFCMTEDVYGAMWFGSVNGGLTRFDGREFRHYTTAHGLVSNNVRELYYSARFDLLFIGCDRGFSVFNGRTFHSFASFENDEPYAMSFMEGAGYMDVLPYAQFCMWRYYPATANITANLFYSRAPLPLISPQPSTSPLVLPSGDTLIGHERRGFRVQNHGLLKSFRGMGQVFDMTADEEGNAWLAAWSETPESREEPGGLFKYDGVNCIRYSEKAGITDPGVWGLYYDRDFRILWVGTINSGLYKIPMSPFEWFSARDLPVKPANPYKSPKTLSAIPNPYDALKQNQPDKSSISTAAVMGHGQRPDDDTHRILDISPGSNASNPPEGSTPNPLNGSTANISDRNNSNSLDGSTNNSLKFYSLLVSASGDLFAGSESGILHLPAHGSGFRWLDLSGVFQPGNDGLYEFRCLREDSRGNIYATWHNPALVQFSNIQEQNPARQGSTYNHSLSDNTGRTDDHNPVHRFSTRIQWTFESTQHFDIDTRDTAWYGNKWYPGVVRTPLHPQPGKARTNHVLTLLRSNIQYSPPEARAYPSATTGAPKFVVSVEARGDTMWYISRYDGLYRSLHGKFENMNLLMTDTPPPHSGGVYYDKPALPRNIRDLCFDESYNLYLGTDDGDVWILGYSHHGVWVRRILHGGTDLIGDAVKFMVADRKGHLWVGTNLGLNLITLPHAAAGNMQANHYHAGKGMPYSNRFYNQQTGYYDFTGTTAACDHNGNLWIGTDHHLLRVNAHHTPPPAPNLQITALEVNMQPNDPGKVRKVPHYRNNFVIHFAATNYLNPQSDLYRYKVEGLTDQWTEFGTDTKAVLSALNPGTYTFRAEAINLLNDSAKASIAYTFTIGKPWYATIGFNIGALLLLIATIVIIIRRREADIRRKEQQKTMVARQLATLEMRALQSQMNPHFIFNCINSIQGLILNNKTREASGYLLDFSRLMRLTLEFASSERISLDDELQYLRHYLSLEEMRFDGKFRANIQLDSDLTPSMIHIPPMIIQPHLENAIHHGLMPKMNGDAQLTITFREEADVCRCIIEDNGIGRQQAALLSNGNGKNHHSFSTRITRERIDILNRKLNTTAGRIDIQDLTNESGDATGTRVIIVVPL